MIEKKAIGIIDEYKNQMAPELYEATKKIIKNKVMKMKNPRRYTSP
jgi:hypothetical protein